MQIKVFVTPEVRRERVEELGAQLKISVKQSAQGNAANTRVRQIVADRCNVPLAKVTILSGHRSRGKLLVVSS
jgi:uncharacterized protein YggU (UPF0235/DUF167 family)